MVLQVVDHNPHTHHPSMTSVAVGNRAVFDYNHSSDTEYQQLRAQAQQHFRKHKELSAESQQSYQAGDKARAKQLSEASRREREAFAALNRRAAEFVFVENNRDSLANEIDLHGLYVSEAEYVIKKRLIFGAEHGEQEVRIIVGKGKHSQNGVAKLKPAAEELCKEAQFQWQLDPKNEGVIVVNAQSGRIPEKWHTDVNGVDTSGPSTYQPAQQMQYAQQQHPQQQHPQQQQQQNHQQQSNSGNNNNALVAVVLNLLCICAKRAF